MESSKMEHLSRVNQNCLIPETPYIFGSISQVRNIPTLLFGHISGPQLWLLFFATPQLCAISDFMVLFQ